MFRPNNHAVQFVERTVLSVFFSLFSSNSNSLVKARNTDLDPHPKYRDSSEIQNSFIDVTKPTKLVTREGTN